MCTNCATLLREGGTPLHEAGVGDADREALLPDVDGLQHPSMPQLGRHVVHIEDAGELTEQDDLFIASKGALLWFESSRNECSE